MMMAEGDSATVHSRYSNGNGSAIVVVYIMTMKDETFMEHRDITEVPAAEVESKGKRPMFGDRWPKLSFEESNSTWRWVSVIFDIPEQEE